MCFDRSSLISFLLLPVLIGGCAGERLARRSGKPVSPEPVSPTAADEPPAADEGLVADEPASESPVRLAGLQAYDDEPPMPARGRKSPEPASACCGDTTGCSRTNAILG